MCRADWILTVVTKIKNPWLKKHIKDPYVKLAQQQGFRSRAAYKLLSIQQKDRLFRKGQTVLDLGSAPGAWSQLAQQYVGSTGQLIAIDRLPMQPVQGVSFIQGDLEVADTVKALYHQLKGKAVDLVLSDMAPNLTGISGVDQPSTYRLTTLALNVTEQVLNKGGTFLVKCFQGKGFDDYFQRLRGAFKKVSARKPDASRASSSEVYLLAKGYHIK